MIKCPECDGWGYSPGWDMWDLVPCEVCWETGMKPMRVLDLFCGAGGASMGYKQAGFDEVVGVDIDDQPSYPFEFTKMDAVEYLEYADLSEFDLVHASPPCQGYSNHVVSDGKWTHHSKGYNEDRLIGIVRTLIEDQMADYVIENVVGARNEMKNPVKLCGSMFNRPTPRHRLFETNWDLKQPIHPSCRGRAKAYAQANNIPYRNMSVTGKSRNAGSIDDWREIMEMPWATRARDLSEAIYPRYTEYIGKQYLGTWNYHE